VEASAVVASAEDRVVEEAVAALVQRDQAQDHPPGAEERRHEMRQLFRLVLRCVREGRAEPIITPVARIAAYCFAAGVDLAEAQEAFNVLAEALWRHVVGALAGEQRVEALGLVNAIIGAAKDAQARTYVALAASQGGHRPGRQYQGVIAGQPPQAPGLNAPRTPASGLP
jgi:hypothetical protein